MSQNLYVKTANEKHFIQYKTNYMVGYKMAVQAKR